MGTNFNAPRYEEYFIYSMDYLNLTTATTIDFQNSTVRMSPDAAFKIYATTYMATDARLSGKIKDYDKGLFFQDNASDLRNIAGHPLLPLGSTTMSPNNGEFLPYMWGAPYLLKPSATLSMEVANTSSIANVARISFHGAKVLEGSAPWEKSYKSRVPFTINVAFGAIAANGTSPGVVSVGHEGDFLIQTISANRTGQATVFITESTRGRDWMDKAVHLDNFAGPGYAPNTLLQKSHRFLLGGSALNIVITNLESVANTVSMSFSGYKLYK